MSLILLLSCIETGLSGSSDPPPGALDTGTPTQPPLVHGELPETPADPTELGDCPFSEFGGEWVPQNDACLGSPPQTTSYTPVVEWSKASWMVLPESAQIAMTPIIVPLTDDDGDGDIDSSDTPDILVITYDRRSWQGGSELRAVSGDNGAEHWTVTGEQIQSHGNIAAGDIDGDGLVEVCVPTLDGVSCFENDGTLKWATTGIAGGMALYMDSVTISDMDGDGAPEIISGSVILDNTGALLGIGELGVGGKEDTYGGYSSSVGSTAFAVDLDGDGVEEVVVGNAAYNMTGETLWENGEEDGYVAVADFDLDGAPEVVVAADRELRVQDASGTVQCRVTLPSSLGAGGSPVIADFDGDGVPEIGLSATSLFNLFEGDCSPVWTTPVVDYCPGRLGAAALDFEGDGAMEVIYADYGSVYVFRGTDGATQLVETQHRTGTGILYPVTADVDGDGQAEIIYGRLDNGVGGSFVTGLVVLGDASNTWPSAPKIWNQFAYFGTNVTEDGGIPALAQQPWLDHNSFRAVQTEPPTLHPGTPDAVDLIVQIDEVCELECASGRIEVWVRVANQGFADLELETEIVLWAQTPDGRRALDVHVLRPPLLAGERDGSLRFVLEGMQELEILDLWVSVDGENSSASNPGQVLECEEANNHHAWGAPVCP